ncbi:hypothetical protein F0562_015309 [Nyssa sinensis]|uniref:Uncharacterized protein n=1 Tax=Nyssa sinensis TaxID=561372 RepID=A0A5J4ZJT5_9ASTE|nr:hypothetical protein F0562_015309 [Nyssa sinensis]
MAFSPSSHTVSNGLQATKHHQSQGVSAYSTFNGSLTNKYHPSLKVATVHGSHINKSHHAHGVSATHLQDFTAIRNFEDEEVYASTPVAALHNSPSSILKKSSMEVAPWMVLKRVSVTHAPNLQMSKNVTIPTRRNSPDLLQQFQVTVQPTALSEAIQSITQHAIPIGGQDSLLASMDPALLPKAIATQRSAPTGGGTLTYSYPTSSRDLRGTGPLASLLDIRPAIVGQEERLTDASVTVGHSREIDSCAVTVNP